jgi:sulfonate transport system ATP-binding protein
MKHNNRGTYISAHQLRKAFGDKGVLHDVSLEARPGEFITIVGKSGSGKSTLLRLIAGLDKPTAGEIYIDGQELRQHNQTARVMFQDARLLPWKTVIQNVGLGLNGDWRSRAEKALQQVRLLNRANEWPSVLSGGQRQRVALARALASRPQLLLLDEPLGALDALTRIEMQQLIEHLWHEQQFTAILITHDVEEAVALADRVVLLEDGSIVLDVSVDLPRPRQRGSVEFAALKQSILSRVMGENDYEPDFEFDALAVSETLRAERRANELTIPAYGC